MTAHVMTRDEALAAAALEIARETEYSGTPLAVRRELESPGFWVFYLDSAAAIESGRSSESYTYRIPAVVVNRRTGDVTRPIAAARHLRAAELGPGEWFIAREPRQRAPRESVTGLELTPADEERIERLEHFRVRRGGRDDGDRIEATLVAESPDSIAPGLAAAGIRRTDPRLWTIDGRGSFLTRPDPEHAAVSFTLLQNGLTDNSWTFGSTDIELALALEEALKRANWIRFWY